MVVLGIALLLVVLSIFCINSLLRKRNQTDFAFSTVDVLLKKRYDLIPNLVEMVRGYAEHEQKLYGHIAEMRSQAFRARNNSTNTTSTNTTSANTSMGQRFNAETEISQDLGQIFIISEYYPELQADSHFRRLYIQLVDIENQIAAARRFFNASVNEYNDAVENFPSSVFASLLGMEEKAYFRAEVTERAMPSFRLSSDEEPAYQQS